MPDAIRYPEKSKDPPTVMPDPDPASRRRTEKAKTLDSRFRGNDDLGRSPVMPDAILYPEKSKDPPTVMPDSDPASRKKEKAKALDPRLKTSGMTTGVFAGMTTGGSWGWRLGARGDGEEAGEKDVKVLQRHAGPPRSGIQSKGKDKDSGFPLSRE